MRKTNSMEIKRAQKIEEIIAELKKLKTDLNGYAVEKNIEFFEAIKSPMRYIGWLLFSANKIDKEQILELSDFPKEEWEEDLHKNLIKMERKKIPGMIEPLKKKLVQIINDKNPRLVVNLGAGAMELERQIIEVLLKKGSAKNVTFVAIDKSIIAKRLAVENLAQFKEDIELEEVGRVTKDRLLENNKKNIRVILCSNDIFELDKEFGEGFFDVVCFAKFKHHLQDVQKKRLDTIIAIIGKYIVEFDDYRSWWLLIPQSIATWGYPVLMNGAVFSRLRDYTKKELRGRSVAGNRLSFFKNGSYMIESIKP